jgi:hypothetical protein
MKYAALHLFDVKDAGMDAVGRAEKPPRAPDAPPHALRAWLGYASTTSGLTRRCEASHASATVDDEMHLATKLWLGTASCALETKETAHVLLQMMNPWLGAVGPRRSGAQGRRSAVRRCRREATRVGLGLSGRRSVLWLKTPDGERAWVSNHRQRIFCMHARGTGVE